MDMSLEHSSSPSSSTAENGGAAAQWPWPPKRPAGRTKFRETRHPVFRGVRRRGNAGRWVCEVRVPGERGTRLWLGTYVAADAAARAHDAAMLKLRGRSAACLNFPDSAWLLDVPPTFADLADIRRAAVQAVTNFLRRREAAGASSAAAAVQEAISGVSAPAFTARSSETAQTSAGAAFEAPTAALEMDSDVFDLDCLFGETELDGYYYASLAQGLLMDPPPQPAAMAYSWENGDWRWRRRSRNRCRALELLASNADNIWQIRLFSWTSDAAAASQVPTHSNSGPFRHVVVAADDRDDVPSLEV